MHVQVPAQRRADARRILIRDEPEVDLRCRLRGDHGLAPRSGEARPDAADVARRLEDGREVRRAVVALPRELGDAVDPALVVGLERERTDRRELGVRWCADVIVEGVDEDPAVLVDERLQGVDQPPSGVRQVRRAAGVRVADHRAGAELDVVDALPAEQQVRMA